MEEPLHVGLGRRATVDQRVGVDKRERLLLGSGVVRLGLENEVEDLWCASASERR